MLTFVACFQDTFEDAQDAAPVPAHISETASVRSLTQRSLSNSRPPAAEPEKTDKEEEKEKEDSESEDEDENESKQAASVQARTVPGAEHQKPEADAESDTESKDEFEEIETTSRADDDEVTQAQQRLSVQSNGKLDNVSLDDGDETDNETPAEGLKGSDPEQRLSKKLLWLTGQNPEEDQIHNKMSPSEPEPDKPEPPKKTISLSSITNSLPAMPWSPGPQQTTSPTKNLDAAPPAAPASPPGAHPVNGNVNVPASQANAPAPPPSRKLAGAFSWLSRSSSKDLTNVSPPASAASPRRNTASSTTTLMSNSEMMLSKLDEEGNTNGNVRHSLKDRFKAMRMREEAGITNLPEDGDANGIAELVNKGPNGVAATPTEEKPPGAVQTPASPGASHASLAPGTASGATAGPSALSDGPVDWDLWQSVVYEGPAAVAKTSAEELSRAIATGIPSAIRGVIWQVLAQSQSTELEAVYRELVVRGTDRETDHQSNGSLGIGSNNGSVKEASSSASSVHSRDSAANGAPSPPPKDFPKEDEEQRKKKKQEDIAMISRLEKTIRRDLGQRTAYSKFASAPGLQEGLYGVCKAYALFDEDVGYAQGMNFLIMPLLFNVRYQTPPPGNHNVTKHSQ